MRYPLVSAVWGVIRRRRFAPWLVGAGLLLAVLYWVEATLGWREALSPWKTVPPVLLLTALVLTLASLLLRAIRIVDLVFGVSGVALREQGFPTIRLALLHNLFNNLLPMRLGELTYPLLMKRYFGRSLWSSGSELLWLRLLDLHFIGLLVFWFLPIPLVEEYRAILVMLWVGAIPLLYQIHWLFKSRTSENRLLRLVIAVVQPMPNQLWHFVRIWLWTVLAWGVKFIAFAMVVIHFSGLQLPQAVFGVIGGELSSVLPLHGIAGAGSYEVATVGALMTMEVPMERALLAALNLHLYLLAASVLFAVLSLLLPVKTDTMESVYRSDHNQGKVNQ